jgi:hypothetical protein
MVCKEGSGRGLKWSPAHLAEREKISWNPAEMGET